MGGVAWSGPWTGMRRRGCRAPRCAWGRWHGGVPTAGCPGVRTTTRGPGSSAGREVRVCFAAAMPGSRRYATKLGGVCGRKEHVTLPAAETGEGRLECARGAGLSWIPAVRVAKGIRGARLRCGDSSAPAGCACRAGQRWSRCGGRGAGERRGPRAGRARGGVGGRRRECRASNRSPFTMHSGPHTPIVRVNGDEFRKGQLGSLECLTTRGRLANSCTLLNDARRCDVRDERTGEREPGR